MVKQAVCDRCGAIIGSEDEDGGELLINEMSDEWEDIGCSRTLGDVCGVCVRSLKAWLQSGGAKKQPSHGQGS